MHTCTEVDNAHDSILSTHHETSTETPVLVHGAVEIRTVTTGNTVEEAKEALKRAQEL